MFACETHRGGISNEHDDDDHKQAGNVVPGSLQRRCYHVRLGVEPEQVPQFDTGKYHQEGDQVLELRLGDGGVVKTDKPTETIKM